MTDKIDTTVQDAAVQAELERLHSENETATLKAQLAALQSQNEALRAKAAAHANRPISYKVSPKGAVSIYGLNAKWPVTLYASQMVKLLDKATEIRKFMADNDAALAKKVPTTEA